MALILSHGGNTSFTSSSPSNEILVGTREGVVFIKRENQSSQWKVAHRALTDKHVHAILVEPVSGTILVGATRDGIFASVDGGQHWSEIIRGLAPISKGDHYAMLVADQGNTRVGPT